MELREVQKLVAGYDHAADGASAKSRELILSLLEHTPEPLARYQFTPGHITCTGLVLSPSLDRVLLVHHVRLSRWLLPGGHIELEDRDVAESARREVLEETGAELDPAAEPFLTGMDVHGIPPRRNQPYHLHHDLIFAFRAVSETAVSSPESRAVRWCPPAEFDLFDVPWNVRLAFQRVVAGINPRGDSTPLV